MALEIVLDGPTSLNWSVDADADYTQAEEEEHG